MNTSAGCTKPRRLKDSKKVQVVIPRKEYEEAKILHSYFADLFSCPASFNSVVRMALRELKQRLDHEMVVALCDSPRESMKEWEELVRDVRSRLLDANGIEKPFRKEK